MTAPASGRWVASEKRRVVMALLTGTMGPRPKPPCADGFAARQAKKPRDLDAWAKTATSDEIEALLWAQRMERQP